MDVGYIDFNDGKQYVYVLQDGKRIFLRNVAFIVNPACTKLLVVHNVGTSLGRGWEPPKGLCEWADFDGAVQNGKVTLQTYNACLRAAMVREVVEEAKILPNELRNVHMLPYAYYGVCDVQNNNYMYQFWTATITERTMQKAQQRQRELHTNPDWIDMVPSEIKETDGVDWWDASTMHLTHGPAEKMTRAYLKLVNKHSDNV